jgi:hypothetical protein
MIDLRNETPLSLAQAAKLLPPGRRGRPVTLSCVLRWILRGVKTPRGLVRLEASRMGGRWLTTVEALERFADRQTPKIVEPSEVSVSPGNGRRSSERVALALEKLGI